MVPRITLQVIAVLVLLLTSQSFAANTISVSKIDGLDTTTGGLMANTPIRFFVHYQVGEFTVQGFTNGFRVYSPDGAVWQPLVPIELIDCNSLFDIFCGFLYWDGIVDGTGADTIGVGATVLAAPGLVPGFDEDYFLIETSLTEEQIGKTLCLDSSFFDVSQWLWITSGGVLFPSWDGPHCFEIVDCCSGKRGDVNGDGKNNDILDLTRLVNHIFRGAAAPDCELESDVNGDGAASDIIDVQYIVDFIFRGGAPSPACPN